MGRFSRVLRRASRRRWFTAVGRRVAAPIDRVLFRLSPRWLDAPLRREVPTLMLETTGRRSGTHRVVPLLYLTEDDGWVVVATDWGGPEHPGWSANLLADPAAVVGLSDGRRVPVRARRVDETGFEARWDRFVAAWPAFADYRAQSDRDIRMFVLEPA